MIFSHTDHIANGLGWMRRRKGVYLGALWVLFTGVCLTDVAAEKSQKVMPENNPSIAERLRSYSFPGGIYQLVLTDLEAGSEIYFDDNRVYIDTDTAPAIALIGLSAYSKVGEHRLRLQRPNREVEYIHFEVQDKAYKTTRFNYPKKFQDYDEQTLAKIKRESEEIRAIKTTYTATKPKLDFIWPAQGRISSLFGTRRVYKNTIGIHRGVDVSAPIGTKVSASSDGVVICSREYYLSGKTLIIDHGAGVHTLYSHLDEIHVREGRVVAKGELVGAIGNTGRSTGPHLHFSIGFNGYWVDPMLFLPATN